MGFRGFLDFKWNIEKVSTKYWENIISCLCKIQFKSSEESKHNEFNY